eukprot:TRINITY_DN7275_c0_g1_i1.p3 TRINITY_DN7275_c0_g1~~TRINITY_DN7275_c0_g1_i1.p3  ORF type:complete len:182 (-),score=30.68 TRINITY_DN7275_c0_g1_i1:227-733(-)
MQSIQVGTQRAVFVSRNIYVNKYQLNKIGNLKQKINGRQRVKNLSCNVQEKNEDELVQSVILPTSENLEEEKIWIADQVRQWLDDEWTPLEVHEKLGEAAGEAYVKMRETGENELSAVLLGMGSDLLSFNYRETFVNAFDVANKVSDLLMQKMGMEVCCTGEPSETLQ